MIDATAEARLLAAEERLEKMERRLDNLDKLITAVAEIRKDIEHQGEKITDLATHVNTLVERPANLWQTVITSIITAVVGGCIGYFISRL